MNEAILEKTLGRPEVPGVYTRLASVYDLWAGLAEGRARRLALERAALQDGEAVLEVAVGTGLLFAQTLRANPRGRNVGVDLTPAMLARARRRAARVAPGGSWELAVGDAYALDFPDASFDVVFNNYMFDLLPEADFPAVVGELVRVLRPGGRLVLVNMTHGKGPIARAAGALFELEPSLFGGCRAVRLSPVLEAAGLKDLTRDVVSQLGVASEVLRAVRPALETAR
ncbi:MAG: methyltransferase domain-containing protein [Deltaproteobacteria bacterium]|nr:methyltransferase domain-containing protein [Deltaproteobacteria bacterium]